MVLGGVGEQVRDRVGADAVRDGDTFEGSYVKAEAVVVHILGDSFQAHPQYNLKSSETPRGSSRSAWGLGLCHDKDGGKGEDKMEVKVARRAGVEG